MNKLALGIIFTMILVTVTCCTGWVHFPKQIGGAVGSVGSVGSVPYVTLFTSCNYKGTATKLVPGYYRISQLGNMGSIMSIQVPRGLLFTMILTNGQTVTIPTSVPCVIYTRFKIATITVSAVSK